MKKQPEVTERTIWNNAHWPYQSKKVERGQAGQP